MKYDLVIKGGLLVTERLSFVADVAVNGEHIAAVGENLAGLVEIDATGLYVIPGSIDGHVHLSDATYTHPWTPTADSFLTGSQAAAVGGVTTLIDFAQSLPDHSLIQALDSRLKDAEGQSVIDYGVHFTLRDPSPARLAEIPAIIERGVPSFKFFMVYDGYRMPDKAIFRAMQVIAQHNGLAIVHAENNDIIEVLGQCHRDEGKTGPRWHTAKHPSIMEGEAVHRILAMAKLADIRVLFFHLSCKEALEALRRAKAQGQKAFGEVCPHYLLLTDDVYLRDDPSAETLQVSPPIRNLSHQQALWEGIARSTVDIVSTDHNPVILTATDRRGTTGIETRLAQLYSFGVRSGRIDLNRWVELCCSQPARLFGLSKKGQIAAGYDADLVLFDPNKERTFSIENLHSDSAIDFCTYEGMKVTGFPVMTFSRGELIAKEGDFIGESGRGRFVHRHYTPPAHY